MQRINFGNTGLVLSRVGLGLAALGRPGYINLGHGEDLKDYNEKKMEAQTHSVLAEARNLGVNYFDAAQSYGKAESFLSSWLHAHPDADVVVGSKWGYYYTAGWSVSAEKHEIKEHTIDRLNLQWPESEQHLSPNLKLYQIHSATFESGVLENVSVLERLDEIKAAGYLIGLSVSGSKQNALIEAALKVQVNGKPLFDSVQATYNCLEQGAEDSLKRAHDQGLGIIIKEGLANGRLTSRNSKSYNQTLGQLARNHGSGEDSIALAYVLSKDFVHVVLSGAAVVDHLKSNIQSVGIDLSNQEIQQLDSLKQDSTTYWKQRSMLDWN